MKKPVKGSGLGEIRIMPTQDTPEARKELIEVITHYVSKEMPRKVVVTWGPLTKPRKKRGTP